MRRGLFFVAPLLAGACSTAPPSSNAPAPQVAPRAAAPAHAAVIEQKFGLEIADPYRWLEDVSAADVRAWMKDRDQKTRDHLTKLPDRDALLSQLSTLLYYEVRSAPTKRGKRLFFSRRTKEQEKSAVYVQEGEKGDARILLDPNGMSADGSVSLGGWFPSWDGKKLAYLVKSNNADESTLKVLDVDTGRDLPGEIIDHLRYTEPSWAADGAGFYYTWLPSDPSIPANERMGYAEIRFHALGAAPSTDKTLREKTGDPTRWQSAVASRDGKYLLLSVFHGWSEQEVYVRFLKDPKPEWKPFAVGPKALYNVMAWKDRFYVATNEGAPRWRVFVVDAKKLDRKQWKEIVPEDPAAVLDEISLVGGHLGIAYLKKASSELQVRTLAGKLVRNVPVPAIGSASGIAGLEDDDTAYFSFSSFVYPDEVYKTSIKSGKTERLSKSEVPVDPSAFEVEQVSYPSKDGTAISMFLVHKKGLAKNGANPTYLYGYGGFSLSMTPRFWPSLYPWLERGGLLAMPNLRGGGEYGETWHQDGMLAKKQHVFDDFIAAAEWLIESKWTSSTRLAASGRSNGGLLVGAAMTQRPDLFAAIVCGVPLLDMVRYAKFGVGTAWVPEYGDPEKQDDLKVLLAYSPYHSVRVGTVYPALLMLSADSDDRVDPMHARKFVAAIEAASKGKPPLLRIETNSGHGGGDLRKKAVEQAADELAFLLDEIGKAPAEAAVAGTTAN